MNFRAPKKAVLMLAYVGGAAAVFGASGQAEDPPRNAALLYKQAFELHEMPGKASQRELDELLVKATSAKAFTERLQTFIDLEKRFANIRARPDFQERDALQKELDDFLFRGGHETDRVRKYLDSNAPAVALAVRAAESEFCDWSEVVSPPTDESTEVVQLSNRAREMTALAKLIFGHAQKKLRAGDIDDALHKYLLGYKLAEHLDARPFLNYLVGTALRGLTNQLIREALSAHSMHIYQLVPLKNQLTRLDHQRVSLLESFDYETEKTAIWLAGMTKEEIVAAAKATLIPAEAVDPNIVPNVDWMVGTRPEKVYRDHRLAERRAFGLPYSRGLAELRHLHDALIDRARPMREETTIMTVDAGVCLVLLKTPGVVLYRLEASYQRDLNATLIGIQVIIHTVIDGRLPETLPANSPEDPFSGEAFDYERTADGFVLRCRGKDLIEGKVDEYVFTVPK